ncbi:MAG: metallophosphoesterase [Chloroflexi bacterium]|nr:metallophosphoesterase [Chloroflexota bacterium]
MPLHILSLDHAPIHELPYQHAGPNGSIVTAQLPILIAKGAGLPPSIDALVCTSDLQGVEPTRIAQSTPRLIGECLADELAVLVSIMDLPPADRIGIILAGDLYAASEANQRGVSGDVRSVWAAFRRQFRWVAGVPGNHDQFGTPEEAATFQKHERHYYLDGSTCNIDALTIAGIGGIIGNPEKPLRRSPEQYAKDLKRMLHSQPDLLVVHESPALPERNGQGSPLVRTLMDTFGCPLTVCGHSRWPEPFAELPNGTQILNVDSRVIVLMR